MLATAGQAPEGDGWAVEPKLDGWRTIVTISGGSVEVRTRSGRNVTDNLPELSPVGDIGIDVVLDGELVASQGRARDFYRVAPRMMARYRRESLTFVAFDVLMLDGVDVMHLAYANRRRLLEQLELDGPAWCTVPSYDATIADVLGGCADLGLEGVVAKKLNSIYKPGSRSRHWRKVKTDEWRALYAPLRHE